jgi:hypothetical protein
VNSGRWIGFLVAVWGLAALPVSAAELLLTVAVPSQDAEGGVAKNRLRLGVEARATDGFDPRWDVGVAFPSPVLTAEIRRPGTPSGEPSLWWDVRSETFPQEWEVGVTSDQPDVPVTLTWTDPPTVAGQCGQVSWTMRDMLTNQPIDVTASAATYTYANQVGTVRRFLVTAARGSTGFPPPAPFNVWVPRQGRGSVYLAWSGPRDPSLRYHVYREDGRGRVRVTASPQSAASYLDSGLDGAGSVTYRVTAVDAQGCESADSPAAVVAYRR